MATVSVASTTELASALATANGGDAIALQPGVYSGLALKQLDFPSGVTITSADPSNKAVLTNFAATGVKGLTFSDIEFLADRTSGNWAFQFLKSDRITFERVFVHGSLDGDSGNDAGALLFQQSTNIMVIGSEFTQLRAAIGHLDGQGLSVAENHIHHVMKAGVIVAGVSDVSISRNTISDIEPIKGEHPDAIQFFTTNTKAAAKDIVVEENVILRGDGGATQGIFFRDQVGTLPYENVTISKNLIIGTGPGGIYVVGAKDLKILDNNLVSTPGNAGRTNLRVENAENVETRNNEAVSIFHEKVTGLLQSGNEISAAVDDMGQAALRQWQSLPLDDTPALSTYIRPMVSVTPTLPWGDEGVELADFGPLIQLQLQWHGWNDGFLLA